MPALVCEQASTAHVSVPATLEMIDVDPATRSDGRVGPTRQPRDIGAARYRLCHPTLEPLFEHRPGEADVAADAQAGQLPERTAS